MGGSKKTTGPFGNTSIGNASENIATLRALRLDPINSSSKNDECGS
jgi:hypothetical protein